MNPQEKYADKIAKLLSKAEQTTPEEAEALIAKAQELMAKYSIEEFMIESARGIETDTIEAIHLEYRGSYRKEMMNLAFRLASVNNCRACWWERTDYDAPFKSPGREGTYRQRYPKYMSVEVAGFASDLRRIELLDTSLRLQAISSMNSWWKDNKNDWSRHTYAVQTNVRKDFIDGFVSAVSRKLHSAFVAGKEQAIKSEAERVTSTEDTARSSVELVLRSRKDRVDDWFDNKHGQLRASRSRGRSSSSSNASNAGYAAGGRADIGQHGLGGKKAITQ